MFIVSDNFTAKIFYFNMVTIFTHYSFWFLTPLVMNFVLGRIDFLTRFVLILFVYAVLGLLLTKQVYKIKCDDKQIELIFIFGYTMKLKWENIDSLTIATHGRDIYTLKSDQKTVGFDTYYGKDNLQDIFKIIVDRAKLTMVEKRSFNTVVYRKSANQSNR